MITKEELLNKYNITEKEYNTAELEWSDLEYIYEDYLKKKETKYKEIAAQFQRELFADTLEAGIHSYRGRVKDEEHLIVKIIRKRSQSYKKYKHMTKENYELFITDLIGFRAFILFKEEWCHFHRYIMDKMENKQDYYIKNWLEGCSGNNCFIERPKVHIRAGDSREVYAGINEADIHSDKIYRSVHYTIKYSGVYVEIQLRTLYEEGWGEIDHSIVYPFYDNDILLKNYSSLLNRLSGLADEMGSFFMNIRKLREQDNQIQSNPEVTEQESRIETTKIPYQKKVLLPETADTTVTPRTLLNDMILN